MKRPGTAPPLKPLGRMQSLVEVVDLLERLHDPLAIVVLEELLEVRPTPEGPISMASGSTKLYDKCLIIRYDMTDALLRILVLYTCLLPPSIRFYT